MAAYWPDIHLIQVPLSQDQSIVPSLPIERSNTVKCDVPYAFNKSSVYKLRELIPIIAHALMQIFVSKGQ